VNLHLTYTILLLYCLHIAHLNAEVLTMSCHYSLVTLGAMSEVQKSNCRNLLLVSCVSTVQGTISDHHLSVVLVGQADMSFMSPG